MRTLEEGGLLKVLEGLTDLEELKRVAAGEPLSCRISILIEENATGAVVATTFLIAAPVAPTPRMQVFLKNRIGARIWEPRGGDANGVD